MAMDRGRWTEAAEHVELAVATIDEHRMQDYATSVPTFVAAARLAVHRGDLKEANRQPSSAILADMHDEWQVSDRRYLSEGSMAQLKPTSNNETVAAISASD